MQSNDEDFTFKYRTAQRAAVSSALRIQTKSDVFDEDELSSFLSGLFLYRNTSANHTTIMNIILILLFKKNERNAINWPVWNSFGIYKKKHKDYITSVCHLICRSIHVIHSVTPAINRNTKMNAFSFPPCNHNTIYLFRAPPAICFLMMENV